MVRETEWRIMDNRLRGLNYREQMHWLNRNLRDAETDNCTGK